MPRVCVCVTCEGNWCGMSREADDKQKTGKNCDFLCDKNKYKRNLTNHLIQKNRKIITRYFK